MWPLQPLLPSKLQVSPSKLLSRPGCDVAQPVAWHAAHDEFRKTVDRYFPMTEESSIKETLEELALEELVLEGEAFEEALDDEALKKEEGEVKEEGKGSSSSEREDRARSGGGEDASSGPNAVSEARGRSGDEEGTTSGSRSCAPGEASSSPSSSSSRRRLGSFSRWSGYVWRRGSVPIRWRQEIKQSIGEAEIVVAKENPYQGTGAYFSRLARAYRPRDSAPETDRGGFPVTCVNLLRCAPGKPELLLSEHFHEAVRGARRRALPP